MTPQQVDQCIAELQLGDLHAATIRDIQNLSRLIEQRTGEPVIHLEMGVPGLQPSEIALQAEQQALKEGCATVYPPNGGIPRLKEAASRFVKAFIDVDIPPLCCVPTTGSMQGTFATFLCWRHALAGDRRQTVLFLDPGFPVQQTQCDVIGLRHEGIDIYQLRGDALLEALRRRVAEGDIIGLVYSNPNNPSWVCLTEHELRGIAQLADDFDLLILEDLAYFAMDFRHDLSRPFLPPFQPTVARYTDRYILSVSGSKAFSYAGQRAGVTCISPALYARRYDALQDGFGVATYGDFFTNRLLYTLSSGTTHSVQHALAALMEAAADGRYDFVSDTREYGRRAQFMKEVLLTNGFELVYADDMGLPLADGFYFTVRKPGLTGLELTRRLMQVGIAVFPLTTMGSHEEGVRICTSFFADALRPIFQERIASL